jgi:hypothetical protein
MDAPALVPNPVAGQHKDRGKPRDPTKTNGDASGTEREGL